MTEPKPKTYRPWQRAECAECYQEGLAVLAHEWTGVYICSDCEMYNRGVEDGRELGGTVNTEQPTRWTGIWRRITRRYIKHMLIIAKGELSYWKSKLP